MALHELRAGDRVHLLAPGVREVCLDVDATVEEDEVAILCPVDKEARAAARTLPVGVPARVTVPLGALARVGTATIERVTTPGGFVVLRNTPFLEQVNRRSSYRVEVAVPVEVACDGGGTVLRGRTVNLSVGGMAAVVRRPVPVGTPVEVTLQLPPGDVQASGVVVGTDGPQGVDLRVKFEPGRFEGPLGTFLNRVETGRARTGPRVGAGRSR